MADIQLNHQSVQQAVDDMVQATQQMRTNLDALLQELRPVASTFTGAAADSWQQFQVAANHADNTMNNDFGQGHVILSDMHQAHISADLRGASIFQG